MNITPAQALLLLINYHSNHHERGSGYLDELIYFYLNGTDNPEEQFILNQIFDDESTKVLQGYHISAGYDEINDDPTRRYFETHLAYESLLQGLDHLPLYDLKMFEQGLSEVMTSFDPGYYHESFGILQGTFPQTGDHHLFGEYHEYIDRLDKDRLFNEPGRGAISPLKKEKLKTIITIAFLSVRSAQHHIISSYLPLDIYGQGTFSADSRGKIVKYLEAQSEEEYASIVSVRNQHYGLMKAHMPLPLSDVAFSESKFNFFKSSEQSHFDPDSAWVRLNFYRKVHPFSNSISGTALCVLRTMLHARMHDRFWLNSNQKEFDDFYRSLASMIVFFSGGHSLFEIMHVLNLPEIRMAYSDPFVSQYLTRLNWARGYGQAWKDTPLGLDLGRACISRLFLGPRNQDAVRAALEKATQYNELYLQKKSVLEDIVVGRELNILPSLLEKKLLERMSTIEGGIHFSLNDFKKVYQQDRRLSESLLQCLSNLNDKSYLDAQDIEKSINNVQSALKALGDLSATQQDLDEILENDEDLKEKFIALKQSFNDLILNLKEYKDYLDLSAEIDLAFDDMSESSEQVEEIIESDKLMSVPVKRKSDDLFSETAPESRYDPKLFRKYLKTEQSASPKSDIAPSGSKNSPGGQLKK